MDVVGGAVVGIACDESGFSGTNLLDAATPMFTHASVDLRVDEAVELIQALRSRFRWSPNEFKSRRTASGAGQGSGNGRGTRPERPGKAPRLASPRRRR
jgi:hypothetical protein